METLNQQFKQLKYKKDQISFIKNLLNTNERASIKALLLIYEKQTDDEKDTQTTTDPNNVGFTGFDAEILSSLAEQYLKYNKLSEKQIQILKKLMPKYWKQIMPYVIKKQESETH